MSDQNGRFPVPFVQTKGYRLFTELCDVCRSAHSIGLGYGPPGTGKTESARYYAQWGHIEPLLPEPLITFDFSQYGGWPVSLSTLYLRFRSIGSPYPGVSNGVLYTSCFCLARTHRKRGDDPVRGLFVSGRGSQSASPGQRRVSGDAPLYTSVGPR